MKASIWPTNSFFCLTEERPHVSSSFTSSKSINRVPASHIIDTNIKGVVGWGTANIVPGPSREERQWLSKHACAIIAVTGTPHTKKSLSEDKHFSLGLKETEEELFIEETILGVIH